MLLRALILALSSTFLVAPGATGALRSETLRVYWVDVEGGAATLIVTPAGESVLVDAGNPGERDPGRIEDLARGEAGLERIDHLVVTHFDRDHYGGAADLAERIPIGHVYDPGIPGDHPYDRWSRDRFQRYLDVFAERRRVLRPGDAIPLAQAGSTEVSLLCIAAKQQFLGPAPGQEIGVGCGRHEPRAPDRTENRNSTVLLLRYGDFDLLDAADLTWNLERQLVCPINLVGKVDVYQVDHHGLDVSNNPVLIRSVEPRVAVMNNGTRKGCMPDTFRTLSTTSSIEAIYQVHRNLRTGDGEGNTEAERIANDDEDCSAAHIELSVASDGGSYTVSVPSKGHQQTFESR